jgi:hypothetical protein
MRTAGRTAAAGWAEINDVNCSAGGIFVVPACRQTGHSRLNGLVGQALVLMFIMELFAFELTKEFRGNSISQ